MNESANTRCKGSTALTAFLLSALGLIVTSAAGADSKTGVQISELADRLRITLNGEPFTEYWFRDVPRPFCYPVIGPGGAAVTRNWPMKEAPDEERDHPHHRSLWFTHGAVNGVDFWSESKEAGKIVHQGFNAVESGKDVGKIVSTNNWISREGTLICTDTRTLRIHAPGAGDERIIDLEVTVFARPDKELVFGDTKEGSMALRLAPTMRLKGKVGRGHIVNSNGVRDGDTWGKRAAWCDYYGPVEGKMVGVAIFDHPRNPRHPTWWHVRDYGLFAANPFGQHDFERLSDKSAGDLKVPAGASVTFRYRVVLHAGDERAAKIADKYKAYTGSN